MLTSSTATEDWSSVATGPGSAIKQEPKRPAMLLPMEVKLSLLAIAVVEACISVTVTIPVAVSTAVAGLAFSSLATAVTIVVASWALSEIVEQLVEKLLK